MPASPAPRHAARAAMVLLPAACALALVPLLAVDIPPIHDYPFHLARADALASLFSQVPHPTHYRLGSLALPNEAMDLVTLGLTAFLPPVVAGRVFLALVLVLLLTGTVALHRALHGRFSPWPLLAALFLYSWVFLYGFTNYLFGVGLMLWSLAAWLAMAHAPALRRVAVASVLAVILLFCHLVAFGLFAVALGGLALSDVITSWWRHRRVALAPLLQAAVPIAIALAIFVLLSPTVGEARQPIEYKWIGWKPLMAMRAPLGSIPWLNTATMAVLAVALGLAAWRRKLTFAPVMLVPLVLLGLTFLVMPYQLFGSLYADARLPIAILLVLIATCDLRDVSPRMLLITALLGVALLSTRSAVIAADWRNAAALFAEYAAAFDRLPPGSTLYAATADPYPTIGYDTPEGLALWHPPLKHVSSLASIGRDVFVPTTWADPVKQPIAVLPRYEAAKRLQGDNPFKTPDAAALATALANIRALGGDNVFLLLVQPQAVRGGPLPDLPEIARGPGFILWRVL